jgi:hypothetical protein
MVAKAHASRQRKQLPEGVSRTTGKTPVRAGDVAFLRVAMKLEKLQSSDMASLRGILKGADTKTFTRDRKDRY